MNTNLGDLFVDGKLINLDNEELENLEASLKKIEEKENILFSKIDGLIEKMK